MYFISIYLKLSINRLVLAPFFVGSHSKAIRSEMCEKPNRVMRWTNIFTNL